MDDLFSNDWKLKSIFRGEIQEICVENQEYRINTWKKINLTGSSLALGQVGGVESHVKPEMQYRLPGMPHWMPW